MKFLTIATVVAMIALLPAYSHALAGKHGGRGAGSSSENSVGSYVGSDAGSYAGPDAPVSVPEPGSFLLLASGLSTLGGLLAGRWYVTKKQAKRPERDEP
jgi:PEP-CTERM motif